MDGQQVMEAIKNKLRDEEYGFLRREPLASQTILLGLGGSYAYGTNVPGSDIDIRGIAVHSAKEILTGKGFEQIENRETDTVVYSLKKIVSLLSECNPNTVEILGLEPWQYIVMTDAGKKLVDNAGMFLSKRAARSFGGYANATLWRLKQKGVRGADQEAQEQHILNSIESARHSFPEKYFPEGGEIRLYTDKAVNPEFETEIFMDISLKHYPLRDYKCMWAEMQNITKSYAKIGQRNSKAVEKGKLTKHMMHLIRLYRMSFDILEEGKIVTYRRKDHEFLMDIRNGKYSGEDGLPTDEFYGIVAEYENRLKEDTEKTKLPDNPDYEKINRIVADINREIVEKLREENK